MLFPTDDSPANTVPLFDNGIHYGGEITREIAAIASYSLSVVDMMKPFSSLIHTVYKSCFQKSFILNGMH